MPVSNKRCEVLFYCAGILTFFLYIHIDIHIVCPIHNVCSTKCSVWFYHCLFHSPIRTANSDRDPSHHHFWTTYIWYHDCFASKHTNIASSPFFLVFFFRVLFSRFVSYHWKSDFIVMSCPCCVFHVHAEPHNIYVIAMKKRSKRKKLEPGDRFALPEWSYLLHMHKLLCTQRFVQQNVAFDEIENCKRLNSRTMPVWCFCCVPMPLKLRALCIFGRRSLYTLGEMANSWCILFIWCNKFKTYKYEVVGSRQRRRERVSEWFDSFRLKCMANCWHFDEMQRM